jgi:hypothetical protein
MTEMSALFTGCSENIKRYPEPVLFNPSQDNEPEALD